MRSAGGKAIRPRRRCRWAEALTPEQDQSDTVGQIFVAWIQRDADRAVNWLVDYLARDPGSAEDDVLVGSAILFSPAARSDPHEALKLADSVANPESRLSYQEQVLQSWGRTDPGVAVDYVLNSTTIAQEQKPMLIRQIQDARDQGAPPN